MADSSPSIEERELVAGRASFGCLSNNNNNNRRLVTLAEHTSDHGKQTNSSTKEKGEHG